MESKNERALNIANIAIDIFIVMIYIVILFESDKIHMSKGFVTVTSLFIIFYFCKVLYRDLSELW